MTMCVTIVGSGTWGTMTADQILEQLLEREKAGSPPYLSLNDLGGRTSWGISERSHPEAWTHGPPTRGAAKLIFQTEYVSPWNWVPYDPLRIQLIDISVLSGYGRAAKLLQATLGVEEDGVVGRLTRAELAYVLQAVPEAYGRLVNNALVAFHLKYIDALTDQQIKQRVNEEGWENRALLFLL